MLSTIEKFVRIILELVLLKFLGALQSGHTFHHAPLMAWPRPRSRGFYPGLHDFGEETTRLGRGDVEHRSCSRKALRPRQARLLRASFGGGISPAILRGAGQH
jgi:hypothetical protein